MKKFLCEITKCHFRTSETKAFNILVAIILLFCMVITVTGCGNENPTGNQTNSSANSKSDKIETVTNLKVIKDKLLYKEIGYFINGMAKVINDNGKYGYIDDKGKEVIACQYDIGGDFGCDLTVVKDEINYYYIDKKGNKKLTFEKSKYECYDFYNDIACITEKDSSNSFAIDLNGNKIFGVEKNWQASLFWLDFDYSIPYYGCQYFINRKGEKVFANGYERADNFSNGFAAVYAKKDGKTVGGFIDKNGATVIEPQYDKVGNFSEGLAPVLKSENKWGYINEKGEVVIPFNWTVASIFSEGLSAVRKTADSSIAYINKKGEVVLETKYDFGSDFHNGVARVRNSRSSETEYNSDSYYNSMNSVLINNKGTELMEVSTHTYISITDNRIVTKGEDGYWAIYEAK
ncbi:MAG: WG repeat-containing protein [Oscillospiraceae bacterium]